MNALKDLWNEKKKLILLCSGIIILVIILILILIVILMNVLKKYEPLELEKMMVTSTQNYLKDHQVQVPNQMNPESVIEVSTLVENEYLKDFAKISKDSNCTGRVKVIFEKEENHSPVLRYVPTLECDHYKTTTLLETILSREYIEDNKEGLNKTLDTYYYRGEYVNNYLEYLGYAWRIFKFDKDMTYLVLADTLNDTSYVYDNRYNEIAKGNRGKNSFENSRIAGTLNGFYNSFFAGHHAYLKTMNACIHSRSLNDTIKDGSIECYTTYSTPIALLSVYDYMNASLDYYCLKSSDRNCSNYNYLAKTTNNFWLLNGTNEDTYKVYVASASMLGALQLEAANSKKYIRVVIALPNDIEYKSGIGTKDKPYTFYEY